MFEKAQADHWLSIQCRLIDATAKGLVFTGEPDGDNYTVAASWPEGYTGNPALAEIVKTAIARRQILFATANGDNPDTKDREIVAAPLLREGKIHGVVALDVPRPNNEQRGTLAQMLHVGSAWLGQLEAPATPVRAEQLGTVVDLTAAVLSAKSFAEASTVLATELAARFDCDRVSFGVVQERNVKLQALSHNAGFSQRQQLGRQIEAAMDEALEQEVTALHPPLPERDARTYVAHAELARWQQSNAICTVPLHYGKVLLGALTFERSAQRAPFDIATVTLLEQLAALLGPILELRRRESRPLIAVLKDAGREKLKRLIGPGHLVTKFATGFALLLVLVLAVVPGRYQVPADAALEGRIERVVAAPQKGYLQSVSARPGDVVKEGVALASLDDRDLKLEQLKWSAKQEQVAQEYRKALAERDRINIGVLSAQLAQAESQLALIEKQLGRVQLIAPFDGVIVSGDFTQALGSPIERGQVMFKLAPLDDYRVILKVDETDIADVREGQHGRLTLTATPDESLDIVVERITPVASADARANYFRVEAKLDKPPNYLRPGMQGVAKIDIGTRQLLWIWTRSLVSWARVKLWAWLP
jgi:RND family efflux transporter MFP subunit